MSPEFIMLKNKNFFQIFYFRGLKFPDEYDILKEKRQKKGEKAMFENDIEYTLISEEEIKKLVADLCARINRDFFGKETILLIILKGSLIFASDLMRGLEIPVTIDFMQASSYGMGSTSSGEIKIKKDMENDPTDKHIIIVEDIIDSGRTLSLLRANLEDRGAASVSICALLSKPDRRVVDVRAEYVGKEIPDEFVVGYGLDFAERYRNLPYIGVLKPIVYQD